MPPSNYRSHNRAQRGRQFPFSAILLVGALMLLGACSANSDEPETTVPPPTTTTTIEATTTSTSTTVAAPTERELIVADAIDAIFAADTETLLALSLDSDAELIAALDDVTGTPQTLLGRLNEILVVSFGSQGAAQMAVEEVGPAGGGAWTRVDVRANPQSEGFPILLAASGTQIDLIASFGAYVSGDLEQLALQSPDVAAALATRLESLQVARDVAFDPLRDDPAALARLIDLLSGGE